MENENNNVNEVVENTAANEEVKELSTEEKKKAINLQDLIYVKKYIDDKDKDLSNDISAEASARDAAIEGAIHTATTSLSNMIETETQERKSSVAAEAAARDAAIEEAANAFRADTSTIERIVNNTKNDIVYLLRSIAANDCYSVELAEDGEELIDMVYEKYKNYTDFRWSDKNIHDRVNEALMSGRFIVDGHEWACLVFEIKYNQMYDGNKPVNIAPTIRMLLTNEKYLNDYKTGINSSLYDGLYLDNYVRYISDRKTLSDYLRSIGIENVEIWNPDDGWIKEEYKNIVCIDGKPFMPDDAKFTNVNSTNGETYIIYINNISNSGHDVTTNARTRSIYKTKI